MRRSYSLKRLATVTWMLLCGAIFAKAQTPDTLCYKHNTAYVWVGDELGIASPGWYGAGSINVMVNGYLYTVKASVNDGLNRNSSFYTDEYALMFGKKLSHNPFGNFAVSAGISLVKVTPQNGYEYLSQAGVPIQLQYFNNAGLGGLAGFSFGAGVNINRGHSFATLTAGIMLGKLREKVKR